MPCWVVPTIAAEIWGVSVDHVLQRVRDGNLPHRTDQGFMFVDCMPEGGGGCGKHAQPEERPQTFTTLSLAEIEALREGEIEDKFEDGSPDDSESSDADEASAPLGDWRAARQRVGVTRVAPAKPKAA